METLHWMFEYGKVFCGYMFLMYIWPSVVFSKHLINKDKIYRFSFCVSIQVVLINSIVLILGLLHILNQWVVIAIFYGVFFVSIAKKITVQCCVDSFSLIYRLVMGTYGSKLFFSQIVKKLTNWIKGKILKIWNNIRIRFAEYFLLLILVVYGMIYFSYGVFQDYNYGFGDMYVHHQWIYGLIEGNIFSEGVYPEAMHCFIYALHTLFGIKVYSCMLFLAGIHVSVFLISAYGLLKEIFHWRFSPAFVLAIFLTLDLLCINEVYGMSRLQWTIPQEFGLYAQFLCALYLIRYLRSGHTITRKKRVKKYIWNENLLLFMMALAASLAIHFYVTIMAFLLCTPFALYSIRKIFKKERFIPLASAVLGGVFIATAPMAGALASGIPFQGSIGWAVGVINGEDPEDAAKYEVQQKEKKDLGTWSVIYRHGYVTLYREERAQWIVGLTGLVTILWIIYQIIRTIGRFIFKKPWSGRYFEGYLPIIMASVLFMVVYVSPELGIPTLIKDSRLCTSEQLLLLTIIIMPLDMAFTVLSRLCSDCILQALSVITTIGIYYSLIVTGNYHGYLYCELTRYNAAIMVTDSITNRFPKYSYTIVSTTDELYQTNQYGRHEELLRFLQEIQKNSYTLPTEYVFLYIEKKPIQYGQSHFFQGPSWLAEEKYTELYSSYVSQCPEINTSDISPENAKEKIMSYDRPSQSYSSLESRTILESKAYLWYQNFLKLNPYRVFTYYEDEEFVCYYIKQNPYALYDLAIESWDSTEGIQWQNQ